MENFFIYLLKPRAWVAKFLLLLLVGGFAALIYYDYLTPLQQFLDQDKLAFQIGNFRVSLLLFAKMLLAFVVLFWVAGIFSEFGEKKIHNFHRISLRNRALFTKAFQVLVYFIAFLIALDILGLDLTGLTIFSGAIGLGIGIGLQKISSNFISGIIMLFERAVEEGDLVEFSDGTIGIVKRTNARFTLIETFESREILIPNEDFITDRVTNWTYSNQLGRVEIKLGVAYGSDLKLVQQILLEAAMGHPRCVHNPAPSCFLTEFADSSVNFILYFWIDGITTGRFGPKSDVLFAIWDAFEKHDITIPFPQRDVFLKNQVSKGDAVG